MKKNIALVVFGAWFGVQVCLAGPLWTPGTGVPSSDFNSVTYGSSLYVAVGVSGGLITSSTGTAWATPSPSDYVPTANDLNAIAYGNGMFVAVGDNGWTVYSSDGVHWTSVNSGATLNNLVGVVYADSKFVAVGDNGTIITSANGSSWTTASYAGGTSDTADNLTSVTYGDGKFVAVGADGNTTFASTNGVTWTEGGNGLDSSYMNGVAFGNGVFVSVDDSGDIATSTDGSNWTPQATTDTGLNGVAYGNGFFVTVENDGLIYLSAGTNLWSASPSGQANTLSGIGYGNGLFVAVGQQGTVLTSSLTGISATPPELNWALAGYAGGTSDTSDNLTSVTYGNGKFVAVGDDGDTTFASADGVTWTKGGNGLDSSYMYGVAFGNGVFVSVDDNGDIATSSNGSTWTPQAVLGESLNGVAWNGSKGGKFVAVGPVETTDGAVYTSALGTSWSPVDPGVAQNLNAIASASSPLEFVAVGDSGTIITSANLGSNWVAQTSGDVNYNLYGVTYGAGHYVAVGQAGTILTSLDAVNWVQPNYPTTANDLNAVAYGDGLYVAVGQNGWTIVSPDATNWTSVSSLTVNNLRGITYGGGRFVAVGDNGAILNIIVPKLGPTVVLPNGMVQVTVTGGASQSCQILYSTDLIHWTLLTTVSLNSSGVGQFDVVASGYRFYRALAVGP